MSVFVLPLTTSRCDRAVEAYLLDFDGDLYRRTMRLSFIHRLRDEVRFNNVQALIDQMHQDVLVGRQVLEVRR